MKKITTIYEKDIYPEKKTVKNTEYSNRVTGKAIVLDNENKIALVGNKQNEFLQLPGGGIDLSEDVREGVIRECLEEIGCTVIILDEVGRIDDYRSRDKKHCINYCYIVKVLGIKGNPKYTKRELEIGMYTKWVTLEEALDIFKKQKKELETGRIAFYNTGFNIVRDLLFLENAEVTNKIYEQRNFFVT